MKVLTFDPGKTTGYSVWKDGKVVAAGGIATMERLIEIVASNGIADFCIYEGFARANASTGDQLQAIEMCGAIQVMAKYFDIELVKQYPAQRKGYVQFAKKVVKQLDIDSNQRPHAIDAIAHGMRFHDKEGLDWPKPF